MHLTVDFSMINLYSMKSNVNTSLLGCIAYEKKINGSVFLFGLARLNYK